jgi:hypothetical protein
MADHPAPDDADDEPPIADAAHLFRDEPASGQPGAGTTSPPPGGDSSGYDLEQVEEQAGAAPDEGRPLAPVLPRKPRGEPRTQAAASPEEATVDQVWSRAAEWGPNLALLGLVGFVDIVLVYSTSSNVGLAFMLLLAGAATLLVLSYPILITLERPVRITPEQAAGDFYGSLSHYVPHYRRMWLLLSSAGRASNAFSTYQGFKNYWKARLAQLRGDRAGSFTPLLFKIEEFKSEKSAGLSAVEATFTVRVYLARKDNEEPIDSIRVGAGLVRGPDQMWYLNRGTLPGKRL